MGYERGVHKSGRYMKYRIKYKWSNRAAHFADLEAMRTMARLQEESRMLGKRILGGFTTFLNPDKILPAGHEGKVIHTRDIKDYYKEWNKSDPKVKIVAVPAQDFDRKGFWEDYAKREIEEIADGLPTDSPAREDKNPIDEVATGPDGGSHGALNGDTGTTSPVIFSEDEVLEYIRNYRFVYKPNVSDNWAAAIRRFNAEQLERLKPKNIINKEEHVGVDIRESASGDGLVITTGPGGYVLRSPEELLNDRLVLLEARVAELEKKLEAQNAYMAHALGGVQMVREELKSVLRVEIQKIINKYEGVQ